MNVLTNVAEFGQAWWGEVRKKVRNAAVFLDSTACECLHWNGGAAFLLEAGALTIKEFSTFETVPEQAKKGVFISSFPFHGTNHRILEGLIKKSKLEYCIIITAAHISVHHLLAWGGGREGHELEAFNKLEQDVLNWMGNMNYTVEIFYYPICSIHPVPDVFLIPSAKKVMPILPSSLQNINEQLSVFSKQADSQSVRSVNDLTFANLPLEMQANIRQLVYNLNQILQHMNGKEEIYTVGSYSRIVGTELEALNTAKLRRKTATNKISVIFVDRILDLATATKHSSDCWFDRFLETLSKLHENSNDVAVPMTKKSANDLTMAPGCIAPQADIQNAWKLMDEIFHINCQTALRRITASLTELCGESTDSKTLADILENNNKNWDFIENHMHLYQVAKAIQECHTIPKKGHLDQLEQFRKSLIDSIDDEDAVSPLMQVLHLFKTRKDSHLSLDDIMVLLMHLYSICGELSEELFTPEIEDRLQGLIAEIIVEESENLSDAFQEFVGLPVDEVKAHRAAQKVFSQLRHISGARCFLKRYGTIFNRESPAMPIECDSLLKQIVEDLFDSTISDNPDVESRSGSLKDLLKTGFSLFVNVRKPKPVDNPTIMIYVCGGLRPNEVKLVQDILNEKSLSHKIVIASSHFLSSYDTLDYIFRKH